MLATFCSLCVLFAVSLRVLSVVFLFVLSAVFAFSLGFRVCPALLVIYKQYLKSGRPGEHLC